jgi:hypothetical protein
MNDSEHDIVELAAGCVLAVEQATGVQLDFTQDTLPILDHYAGQVESREEAVQGLVASMCGAYFGEVIRRSLGPARWYCPKDAPEDFRLEFEDVFLSFNPVGVALEAIAGESLHGVGSHFEVLPSDRDRVKAALELFGDAREEDYYRFGVRFEAIEQVVHTLATLEMQHENPRKFGPEAYDRLRVKKETVLH